MLHPLGMKEQVRQKVLALSKEGGITSNKFIVKTAFILEQNKKTWKKNLHISWISARERSPSYNLRFVSFFLKYHIAYYTLKYLMRYHRQLKSIGKLLSAISIPAVSPQYSWYLGSSRPNTEKTFVVLCGYVHKFMHKRIRITTYLCRGVGRLRTVSSAGYICTLFTLFEFLVQLSGRG